MTKTQPVLNKLREELDYVAIAYTNKLYLLLKKEFPDLEIIDHKIMPHRYTTPYESYTIANAIDWKFEHTNHFAEWEDIIEQKSMEILLQSFVKKIKQDCAEKDIFGMSRPAIFFDHFILKQKRIGYYGWLELYERSNSEKH